MCENKIQNALVPRKVPWAQKFKNRIRKYRITKIFQIGFLQALGISSLLMADALSGWEILDAPGLSVEGFRISETLEGLEINSKLWKTCFSGQVVYG